MSGLLFVAMSINLAEIVGDATHRNRAIGTLFGFTYSFILCGLALMGTQGTLRWASSGFSCPASQGFVYVRGYIRAFNEDGSRSALSMLRTVLGTVCYLTQMVGAVLLILGYEIGIYLAGGGMMIFFALLISGAWLLLVGICDRDRCPKG